MQLEDAGGAAAAVVVVVVVVVLRRGRVDCGDGVRLLLRLGLELGLSGGGAVEVGVGGLWLLLEVGLKLVLLWLVLLRIVLVWLGVLLGGRLMGLLLGRKIVLGLGLHMTLGQLLWIRHGSALNSHVPLRNRRRVVLVVIRRLAGPGGRLDVGGHVSERLGVHLVTVRRRQMDQPLRQLRFCSIWR